MNDYLVKAFVFNKQARVYVVSSSNLVEEARERHDTWPTASAALGRTLTCTLMMGAMLKNDERISVRIDGGGPVGKILANSNSKGEVNGYISNPHIHLEQTDNGKLNVGQAVGNNGFLQVTKDLNLKEPWVGQIPLQTGEIAEDFTYYFATSEQTPSAVSLGVLVDVDNKILASGGFIVQIMPDAEDEVIDKIENVINEVAPISTLIHNEKTPEQIIELMFGENNYEILETMDVRYKCDCSWDRYLNGIISLGKEAINDYFAEQEEIEAVCHFCGEKYKYTKNEVEQAMK